MTASTSVCQLAITRLQATPLRTRVLATPAHIARWGHYKRMRSYHRKVLSLKESCKTKKTTHEAKLGKGWNLALGVKKLMSDSSQSMTHGQATLWVAPRSLQCWSSPAGTSCCNASAGRAPSSPPAERTHPLSLQTEAQAEPTKRGRRKACWQRCGTRQGGLCIYTAEVSLWIYRGSITMAHATHKDLWRAAALIWYRVCMCVCAAFFALNPPHGFRSKGERLDTRSPIGDRCRPLTTHRITEACCFLFATLLSLWLDISAVQHDSVYRWIILSMLDVSLQL